MAGPLRLHFDVWGAETPKGDALGELTSVWDKEILDVVTDGIGSGAFVRNRHDVAAGFYATGNLVRARLEPVGTNTGPWEWDDPRYFHAFYIEDDEDEILGEDEEAGDTEAKGGRGILSVGDRLVWWKESFSGNDFLLRPTKGYWRFPEGDELGHLIQKSVAEWAARAPNPRPGTLDIDFTGTHDTDGVAWPTFDGGPYKVTFGTTYLQSWLDLVTQGIEIAMNPAFVMSGWGEDGRGTDRTATVCFRGGWNVRQSASRERHAPHRASRALVKGDSEEAATFEEATYAGTAADEAGKWGRREMYVEFERSSKPAVLQRAGARALRRAKRWDDGPPTIGVTTYGGGSDGGAPAAIRDLLPYTDYFPGDLVTLDIEGEYNNQTVRIVEIGIADGENGEAEVSLTFDDEPFSSSGGATGASAGGGSGGGGNCTCGGHTHPPGPPEFPPECTPIGGTLLPDCGVDAADGDNAVMPGNYRDTPAGNPDDAFLPYWSFGSGNTGNLMAVCDDIVAGGTYRFVLQIRTNSGYGIYRLSIDTNSPTVDSPVGSATGNYPGSNTNEVLEVSGTIPADATACNLHFGATYGGWQVKSIEVYEVTDPGDPDDPFCLPAGEGGESTYPPRSDDPRLDPRHVVSSAQIILDGAGSTITLGDKADIVMPYPATLIAARLLAEPDGDATVDVWKAPPGDYPPTDADSITAGNELELVAAGYLTDDDLTGWTVDLAEGDTIRVNLDAVADIERLTVALIFDRTV